MGKGNTLAKNEEERKAFFGGCKKEGIIVIRDEKVRPFVKFEKIVLLLCCLLDLFTNKHCSAWSSMIILWIDSRTCQKYRILLSAKQRPNNYLELSKENVYGEYDTITLTTLYSKVLHDMVSQNL